ncbi:hypothetical protein LTR91_025250 [Friedmanniomyces endolithicus]|uniref:Uncharacterized protein n=1 Tax=Friedmanniomyces endolithicus TaxID=329885 RepID=A0AAN6F8F7_9PEZI|nr:hypothetical protein LTR35_017951 [Friedmanniomyces endolithicus]KAK0267541.1 hypothetical protein LTS00_017777 [Friedmanniomyces endolithicus]KAK0301824.1 hypothetical protein LTR01_009139 [Friedmanniomyces endolithicus]KAK0304443.1 hypothetical protein LTR82_017192 [Friedmanniomyces endolithicus]KAK0822639.1 hypothetical protein LTR73_009165 [Friedmanniomyces endolithicus]
MARKSRPHEILNDEIEYTKELLKEMKHSLNGYKLGKGTLKMLKTYLCQRPELAPEFEVDKNTNKKMNVTKFSNYLLATMGQISKGRIVHTGDKVCGGRRKGEGKSGSCVQAEDPHGDFVGIGSCMDCLHGSSSKKCSLSLCLWPGGQALLQGG